MPIHLHPAPTPARLRELGVEDWPTWGTGISRFPWTYDAEETCYVLEAR